jgi:hypothetical protein
MKRLLALLALWPALAVAQPVGVALMRVNVAPTGLCQKGDVPQFVIPTGSVWTCQNIVGTQGAWAALAGSGSGTVNAGTTGQIGYYAADGTAVSGTNTLSGVLPVTLSGATGFSTTMTCDSFSDLPSCIAVAKTYATNNPTTGGHGVRVLLADKTYSGGSFPITLYPGIQIIGILPRQKNSASVPPDYNLSPNGGTWIDCGGNDCFAGGPLSGNVLENLGFTNFKNIGIFGGQDVIGMSESIMRNIFAVGNSTCCSSNGFTIYNPQNVDTYNVHMLNVDSCWKWLSDNTANWGPGNNNIYNTFCKSYAKSAANGNASVPLMTVGVSAGTDPLILMKFTGLTQLQSYGGDNTGTALSLIGNTNSLQFDALDIEGALGFGVTSSSVIDSVIKITQTNLPHTSAVINLSGAATLNVIESGTSNTTVVNSDPSNMFYGIYYQLPTSGVMSGAYRIYNSGQVLTSLQADSAFVTNVNEGLFMTTKTDATSGGNFVAAPESFCGNYWTDSASTQDCFKITHAFSTAVGTPTVAYLKITKPSGLTGQFLIPIATYFGSTNQSNIDASGQPTFAGNINLNGTVFHSNFNYFLRTTTAATSGANNNSPAFNWYATFWNGSASAIDTWAANTVLGSGSNPTSTLTFAHGTNTGYASVSFPAVKVQTARKGTFVCTAGGTITIANVNELATSDVIISLNTAGGAISTPPAMNTVTGGTGFTVLCGAADTSTYNYTILN